MKDFLEFLNSASAASLQKTRGVSPALAERWRLRFGGELLAGWLDGRDGWLSLNLADVLDALTSHRHYKQAWSMDAAIAELDQMVTAGQFDADCVAAVKRRRDAVEVIRERFQDG